MRPPKIGLQYLHRKLAAEAQAVPVAAGMSPAAVGAKSVVSDRKKTLNAYAVQTADVSAAEILKAMAGQGWVKLNDKGDVIP